MAREEQEELSVRQETPSLLQFDKKTDAKVVEAKKKSYLQQNSSTFSQLVAEAKARRDSKKSAGVDLKGSSSGAGASRENTESEEDASGEERVREVFSTARSALSGTKRGAEDMSTSLAVSSEKRARSGGRETHSASSTSSRETQSSYLTTATHADRILSGDNVISGPGEAKSPLKTPVKKSRDSSCGLGKLYVTPTKTFIQELAKSPKLKNTSIVDVLNRSMSQAKMVTKATCPVCKTQVTEKFLNIHLDKCLR